MKNRIRLYAIGEENIILTLILAAIASAVLSITVIDQRQLVNSDGYLYIEAAIAYINSGFDSASSVFSWPYFAILGGLTSKLLGVNIELAFSILSTAAYIIICCYFIKTIYLLSKSKQAAIVAAILILSFAQLNEYRDMVIRDPGAWAAFSVAIYHFTCIKLKTTRGYHALCAILSLLLATAFRVEYAAFLLLSPALILMSLPRYQFNKKVLTAFILSSLFLFAALIGLGYLLPDNKLSLLAHRILSSSSIIGQIHAGSDIIKENILNPHNKDYPIAFYFGGVLSAFITKLVTSSLGGVFIILVLLNVKGYIKYAKSNPLILMLLAIMLAILSIQMLYALFLSSRYIVGLDIILLYPLALSLNDVFKQKRKQKKIFAATLLFITMLDSFITSKPADKSYYLEAAKWQMNNIPKDAKVTSNERRMRYLATGKSKTINDASYFIEIRNVNAPLKKNWMLIHQIKSSKKEVAIYQRSVTPASQALAPDLSGKVHSPLPP